MKKLLHFNLMWHSVVIICALLASLSSSEYFSEHYFLLSLVVALVLTSHVLVGPITLAVAFWRRNRLQKGQFRYKVLPPVYLSSLILICLVI